MEVLIIFQLLLLLWASPTECQQCTNQDWSSTFAVVGDSMSQCNTNRSYVNALISQGYGVNLQTGPSIIEMARCCGVNLPYSQESNDCYWEQWWVWRHDSWATCRQGGYLIHGFFTTGPNFLSDIGMAQCCKPTSHPGEDGLCNSKKVDFTVDGTKECDEGFFLKGLKKSSCTTMNCLTDIRCCRMVPGRVNGSWSNWAPWEACSSTCGPGNQIRRRLCNNPPPSGGGSMCSGLPFERRQCNMRPCPVDGDWSDWTDWGDCSVTCGRGSQLRSRTCTNPAPSGGGADCSGARTESRECVLSQCPPVDGGWSEWSSWSACSVNCGWKGGKRKATRTCTNPRPSRGGKQCRGKSEKKEVCNKFRCRFTQWSAWGPCDKSCGGGRRSKTRVCLNGQPCLGKVLKRKKCNTQPCP